jgi:DNA-binding GntR family transcriptional regulator
MDTGLPSAEHRPDGDAPVRIVPGELLSDKAYRMIEERIVTLALAPGTVLTESALAGDLGIGRTPVREALQRLAREGMVQFLPNKGVRVSEIDTKAQLRLLEVRRPLEVLTATLAADRATPDQRERFRALEQSFRLVASHSEDIVFLRLDRAFNQLLPEAAHNPYCATMMSIIEGLARRFFFRYRASLDLARTAELHADIAGAVAAGDGAAARAAVDALVDYNARFAVSSLTLP